MFRYGLSPPPPQPIINRNMLQQNTAASDSFFNPQSVQSPHSFHPVQMSTPMVNNNNMLVGNMGHPVGVVNNNNMFSTPGAPPINGAGGYNQQQQQQQSAMDVSSADNVVSMSPLHNALYLYMARLLRPVWDQKLLRTSPEDKKTLESSLSSEECGFLAKEVDLFARFLSTNANSNIALANSSKVGV